MNLKTFSIVLGSASMLFASACVVTSTNGTGGSGGTGGNDVTTTTTSAGGAGGTGAGVGGGGGAGGGECVHCAAYITDGMGTLCKDSEMLYDALSGCICGDPNNPAITSACGANGSIDMSCADNSCQGKAPTAECSTCQTTASQAGGACKQQFDDCSGDI